MIIYAFDVDETLEISGGPVRIASLLDLKAGGDVLGLCGNWAMVTMNVPWWNVIFSFFNAGAEKAEFLAQIKKYVPASDYVMVGNILGVSGSSDDKGASDRAGWRFIKESDFAAGER